ncbi:MAG TPA: adenosylcobinamide-phosphate synthase CbiB [Roseiarcus sp.]|nr:adenosylcobinamide-phosphate synthase CbiB [Roseiarcus sp.]
MSLSATFSLAFAALAIEAAIGYPPALFKRFGHPVTWIGALISATEAALNRERFSVGARRALGAASLVLWLTLAAAVSGAIVWAGGGSLAGFAVLALCAASLPAQRSLYDHVKAVAEALERGGVAAGRQAVSLIVGRRPEALDEAGVARAAIESLAENFSDGIVAPAFWLAVAGLPGGALYKTINTADSMIGHRTARFEAFGWAAARLDDLVNLPASRLAALWLVLAALLDGPAAARAALGAVVRDASRHRSPNAGWPEAAMAGALGLRLAGPRVYGETLVEDAFMGDGRRDAKVADIRRALALYRRAAAIQFLTLAVAAAALIARSWPPL